MNAWTTQGMNHGDSGFGPGKAHAIRFINEFVAIAMQTELGSETKSVSVASHS